MYVGVLRAQWLCRVFLMRLQYGLWRLQYGLCLIHCQDISVPMTCFFFMRLTVLPSGNHTWFAGKWTIEIGDFSSYKPPFSSGIFQLAMLVYQRVTTVSYTGDVARLSAGTFSWLRWPCQKQLRRLPISRSQRVSSPLQSLRGQRAQRRVCDGSPCDSTNLFGQTWLLGLCTLGA